MSEERKVVERGKVLHKQVRAFDDSIKKAKERKIQEREIERGRRLDIQRCTLVTGDQRIHPKQKLTTPAQVLAHCRGKRIYEKSEVSMLDSPYLLVDWDSGNIVKIWLE